MILDIYQIKKSLCLASIEEIRNYSIDRAIYISGELYNDLYISTEAYKFALSLPLTNQSHKEINNYYCLKDFMRSINITKNGYAIDDNKYILLGAYLEYQERFKLKLFYRDELSETLENWGASDKNIIDEFIKRVIPIYRCKLDFLIEKFKKLNRATPKIYINEKNIWV